MTSLVEKHQATTTLLPRVVTQPVRTKDASVDADARRDGESCSSEASMQPSWECDLVGCVCDPRGHLHKCAASHEARAVCAMLLGMEAA